MDSQRTPLDNTSLELNWVRTGPRDLGTVVLIHPVGLDLTYWGEQIEALRTRYDVIAFDLPGHGRSPGRPEDVTFARFAAATAALIEQQAAAPVHVVGISVGGMIAQTLALSHPALVRSLTLIATAATFSQQGRTVIGRRAEAIQAGGMAAVVAPFLERWFTPETLAQRPDITDRITKTLLGDDPSIQAAMWTMVAGLDVLERLSEIECPTLVLVGDRDPSTPPAFSAVIAEHIAGSQMAVLPDASHMIFLEQPDLINRHLMEFLKAELEGV